MRTITLAEFNSPVEAQSLYQLLIKSGIHAEIQSGLKVNKMMSFFRPSAGVRIEVPRIEFEAAFKLVYDWNAEQKSAASDAKSGGISETPWLRPEDTTDNPWKPL